MVTRRDAIGNLIGRLGDGDRRTLLLGSHLDTVRDAGRYDGMLGVLVAIACVERLRDQGQSLPYALEVLAFADEEGVRYGTGYLGSSVVAGRFDGADLQRRDSGGVTLADAVRAFGGDPDGLTGAGRDPADLIGYYEVHIEQGPALEAAGRPARGRRRDRRAEPGPDRVHRRGRTRGHRADGLAARCAERRGRVRQRRRGRRTRPRRRRRDRGGASGAGRREERDPRPRRPQSRRPPRRGLGAGVRRCRAVRPRGRDRQCPRQRCSNGTSCRRLAQSTVRRARLTELVAEAVAACGQPVVRLTSGAGHDAVMLSTIAPIAMLFVRCAGGVSHNPAESVTADGRGGGDRRVDEVPRASRMSFDVLVRGATVVGTGAGAGGERRLDIGVTDGLIAALGPELDGTRDRGDRRRRPASDAGGRRRARALQRARSRRLGGLRDRARERSPPAVRRRRSTCRSTPTRRR